MLSDVRRELGRENDRMAEQMQQNQYRLNALEAMDELLSKIGSLREENESLCEQLAEEKRLRAEQEMKMAEMSKLSAGMAKKASEENLLRAFRSYLNISKRKSPSKREAAKMVFTELFTSAKLDLPEDILDMLAHLDDEQNEPSQQVIIGTLNGTATGTATQNIGEKRLELKY